MSERLLSAFLYPDKFSACKSVVLVACDCSRGHLTNHQKQRRRERYYYLNVWNHSKAYTSHIRYRKRAYNAYFDAVLAEFEVVDQPSRVVKDKLPTVDERPWQGMK